MRRPSLWPTSSAPKLRPPRPPRIARTEVPLRKSFSGAALFSDVLLNIKNSPILVLLALKSFNVCHNKPFYVINKCTSGVQNGKVDTGMPCKHRSRNSEIIANNAYRSGLRKLIVSLGTVRHCWRKNLRLQSIYRTHMRVTCVYGSCAPRSVPRLLNDLRRKNIC